jgi:hypothetical protein
MNQFCPASWITTIRRGESEAGEYVADFEYGIYLSLHRYFFLKYCSISRAGTLGATRPSTVYIRGYEFALKDVLEFSTLSSVSHPWSCCLGKILKCASEGLHLETYWVHIILG